MWKILGAILAIAMLGGSARANTVQTSPEAAAEIILSRTPVIDGHNDTPEQLRELFGNDFSKFDLQALPADILSKTHTDIPSLRKGHVGGQFWSVWVDPALPKHEAVTRTLEQIDTVKQMVARYPDTFQMALTASDIDAAMKKKRIASLIGMEGGHSIGGSLAILREMYRAGARYMTITHFLTTDWADSATDAPKHDGLSPFGVEVIKEMNRLGMIADISHVAETTMHDVLDVSRAPVLFTHSNARALLDHPRNVPDAILKRLPANGGVVMVTFVPIYLSPDVLQWDRDKAAQVARFKGGFVGNPVGEKAAMEAWIAANPSPKATIKQVANMIDHVRNTAGIDHVGIGGDFGGVDTLPEGLQNVSTYPALFAELLRRGYTEKDLAKIAQGNVLRVLRGAEAAAEN